MDSRFEPEYQARLNEVWPKFVNHENFDDSFIRPEILESWKRSRAAGVSLDSVKKACSTRKRLISESIRICILLKLCDPIWRDCTPSSKAQTFICFSATKTDIYWILSVTKA